MQWTNQVWVELHCFTGCFSILGWAKMMLCFNVCKGPCTYQWGFLQRLVMFKSSSAVASQPLCCVYICDFGVLCLSLGGAVESKQMSLWSF